MSLHSLHLADPTADVAQIARHTHAHPYTHPSHHQHQLTHMVDMELSGMEVSDEHEHEREQEHEQEQEQEQHEQEEHKVDVSTLQGGGGDEQSRFLLSPAAQSAKSVALIRTLDAQLVAEEILADVRLPKRVRDFYEQQNELVSDYKVIAGFDESDSFTIAAREELAAARSAAQSRAVQLAIEGSLALTCLLICVKFFAAFWSGSIAVIASAVDSALDLLSQGILLATSRFMLHKDAQQYPIGKSRVESLAVGAFAIIMGLAAVFLLYQSILVSAEGQLNCASRERSAPAN